MFSNFANSFPISFLLCIDILTGAHFVCLGILHPWFSVGFPVFVKHIALTIIKLNGTLSDPRTKI